jgi:glyoxylase-like metal-dependent hydrolase (beta-lactamase superfamily II)
VLHTKSFIFNPFQENTYVLYDKSGDAIIVDPGMYHAGEDKILFDFIEQNKLRVTAIVNTHCHLDHVFGVYSAITKYDVPFMYHVLEDVVYEAAPIAAMRYGVDIGMLPPRTAEVKAGDLISVGEEQLQVLFVPGHSPGHICLYHKASATLIAGDTLFAGSIGRTDLPGGNHQLLLDSIVAQLYSLPGEVVVHSGHGTSTTIQKERESNPFVRL